MKTNKNGKTFVRMSLATNKVIDGQPKTEWHQITVWGRQATQCADRLAKGAPVFIEGEISQFNFEENGQKRYYTGITAQSVSFLGLSPTSISAS